MKNPVLICLFVCLLILQTSCKKPNPILSVIAMTEVFGDGQKVTAAIVEYETDIRNTSISANDFSVEGRTVTKVYANTSANKASEGTDGKYVVLELSPADSAATLFVQQGRTNVLKNARISVKQTGTVYTVEGKKYGPWDQSLLDNKQINLVVDDFIQGKYKDPETGETLDYNLFVPRDYDSSKSYPLVMFIHDAGTISNEVKTTLVQGLGAVIWATPAEQAKHECFVLAPQYDTLIVNDDSEAGDYLDITIHLIEELIGKYNIDTNRLYATGQSGGCMMSIAMNIKYPDFFAASFLVAGQWNANLVAPLAKKELWIVVSEGDEKAYPGMNAITAELEKEGAKVSRAFWDGRSTPEEFEKDVEKMLAKKANVNYAVFEKGTVVPEGMKDDSGSNHICAWRIAYTIEGIRDWLFKQEKLNNSEEDK